MNNESRPDPASCTLAAAMVVLLLSFIPAMSAWSAPEFAFRPPAAISDPNAAPDMRDLAARLIPVYHDSDPERYLANLSALQMAVGDYASADISRQSLHERWVNMDKGHPIGQRVVFDMYAHARAQEGQNKIAFAQAFASAYRESMHRLDDHDAFVATRWLSESPAAYQEALQKSWDQQRARDSIDEDDALDLIWKYVAFDAYRAFGPLVVLLNAEDDHRRFTVDNEVQIHTPTGITISAVVVRPNFPAAPLPSLLEFRIDDAQNYAKECAAHGYVGVIAYARGRQKSTAGFIPFEHDGEDARAVIDWVAKQSWSDGRVGMYGEGYSGFIAWAAAKHLPAALKAIATAAASAPGINFPMEGGIPKNAAYGWSLDAMAAQRSDDEEAQLRALDEKWYRSGRRYRDLGRINGRANPIFIRWLNHPSYDGYWQSMLPYQEEFSRVTIPALVMSGYFAVNEPGDLYYFTQLQRYNAHADDTLLIGPYDDTMMQAEPAANLHGYQVDPAALVDLRELRYQWFDHVLKGLALPSLLKERVNYQAMGANEWQHAPSLEAMAAGALRFYLDGVASSGNHRLMQHKKSGDAFIEQKVGFADRTDAAWMPPKDLISKKLAPRHGAIFISDPLATTTEISGLFSGRLDFTLNKMDVDLSITLYELLANGDYLRLFNPVNEFRASYAQERVHRHLLKAGERQQLEFRSERITSRQVQSGSRLVVVLGVSKRPDREINYGTGGDVSEETIEDGKTALRIRWYSDSFIEFPVRK